MPAVPKLPKGRPKKTYNERLRDMMSKPAPKFRLVAEEEIDANAQLPIASEIINMSGAGANKDEMTGLIKGAFAELNLGSRLDEIKSANEALTAAQKKEIETQLKAMVDQLRQEIAETKKEILTDKSRAIRAAKIEGARDTMAGNLNY